MRKEVIIAILLGFLVGILIAYGIYTANKAVKSSHLNQIQKPKSTNASSSPITNSNLTLTINGPENNIVLDQDEATISGQTEAEATIAIITEENEELLMVDNQGFFSSTINLISGVNEIKVIAIAKSGEQVEKLLNVVYSTAEIE